MNDILHLIEELGGLYDCPKEGDRLIGPLVGLESRYDIKNGSLETAQFVTPGFFNLGHIEQHHPRIFCKVIAPLIAQRIRMAFSNGECRVDLANVYILSVPAGGAMLGSIVAGLLDCRYAAAEKRFFPQPIGGMKYEIILNHHQIEPGAQVILVDDVCFTFSVIIGLLKSLIQLKLKPIGIACCVNRSSQTNFIAPNFPILPIISLLHTEIEKYRQDDDRVSHLVSEDKVVWNPRREWPRLLEIMTVK